MGVIYQATEDERKLATEWHGGQASMLYAVASTGALATGTNRPWWNGEPMTDEEWREDLRSRLRMEVAEIRDADGDGGAGPMGRRGPRGLGYGRGYWVFMTTTKPLDRIGRFDTRHAAADYLEDVAIPKAAWLGPPVTLA